MATRPARKPDPTPTPAALESAEMPEIQGDQDDLQSMMAGLAGADNARITVYRVVKNQPLAYVCTTTPDAFSLDELRDRYNGGEFRLFIVKDGTLWKNRRVFVEPPQVRASGEPAPSAMAELAAVMREGFAKQAEAMRVVAAHPPAAPSVAQLFSGIDIPATITAISAALAVLRPPAPPPIPQASESRAMDMFLKGIEIAKELNTGGGGDGGGLMDVVRDLIKSPLLAHAVEAATPKPAVQMPQPARLPPPRPPNPAQNFARETPPPAIPEEPKMNPMISMYLNMLCDRAADNSDTALYAELVLDNMPEDQLMQVLSGEPTPTDALIRLVPRIADHRAWFEEVLGMIAQALVEEDEAQSQHSIPTENAHAAVNPAPDIPGEPADR